MGPYLPKDVIVVGKFREYYYVGQVIGRSKVRNTMLRLQSRDLNEQ